MGHKTQFDKRPNGHKIQKTKDPIRQKAQYDKRPDMTKDPMTKDPIRIIRHLH